MADFDVTVVGAGVVGLAVAARLAPGRDVLVLERRERHGQETSSRNSEVVHAGLYYPRGSLKARLCTQGRDAIYALGESHGVPCRRTGKLIVASQASEQPALDAVREHAAANGVALEPVTARHIGQLEPNVRAVAGLVSPTSGIVSAHGLMDHFLAVARGAGASLLCRAEVTGIARSDGDGYRVEVRTPDGADTLTCRAVVNAAGLEADTVAALAGIDVDAVGYRQHWCKGSYFALPPARFGLVRRLVYPVPGHVSLGVHAVIDLAGRLRFGPDAEYLAQRRADYRVDPDRRPEFGAAVRRLFPDIADAELEPDLAGIRPKLQGPGDGFRDFVIAEESARGLPGLVNLIGIDSPGLTASPAIAEHVAGLLAGSGLS